MTDTPAVPEEQSPSPFANLSNTELAVIRSELARERTDLSETRTDLSETRTDLARDRNRMAAERTLMAWIRTSLSLITFGFGIDRLFVYLNKTQTHKIVDVLSEERLLGLSFITLGTFGLIVATASHWRTLKKIEQKDYTYTPRWSLGMAVAIALAFIGLATYYPLITADAGLNEIVTPDSQIIQNLASLTIFLIMLTMGINFSLRELLAFWRQTGLLARSQLAASVLMPAATLVILLLLHPPKAAILGLTLLAAAPGAPLLTKRVQMTGSSFNYGASLQVTLSLSAVFVVPLILSLFGAILPIATETAEPPQIVKQIAIVQLLPLSIGLGLRQIGSELADEIGDFLTIAANTLFAILAIFLLILSLDTIPHLGTMSVIAIVAIVTISLAIGHFLGGPTAQTRAAVAIASIARNAGLALFLAILNQRTEAIPTILSYLVLGALVAFPYSAWMKRKIAASSSEATAAS
ncbi:MAG: DUF202 domain-containing protein [Spirulina sp.]